jgi:hypothetical protein
MMLGKAVWGTAISYSRRLFVGTAGKSGATALVWNRVEILEHTDSQFSEMPTSTLTLHIGDFPSLGWGGERVSQPWASFGRISIPP